MERAKIVLKLLNKIYPNVPTPLNHKNIYELLISVLLSAQCTDERVNQVTPLLFNLANNPFDMSKVSTNKIYKVIRPCGLAPKKSRAISNLSKILVKKFNGKVPKNFEDLENLPGVGHKTASVVMSQGFGYPAFPVDTHIHRLAHRWGLTNGKNVVQTENDIKKFNGKVPKNFEDLENLPGVGHKTASVVMSQGFGYPAFPVDTHIHRLAQRWGLTNGKNVVQTENDIKKLFPKGSWNKLHLQIIFYGREYCQARNCYGVKCKICKACYPSRRKPIVVKKA